MEKRTLTLKTIFLKYLILLFIVLCISIVVPFIIYSLLLNSNFLLPANYIETEIEHLREKLESADWIDKSDLPAGSSYLILTKDFSIIDGNINREHIDEAIAFAKGDSEVRGSKKSYKLIERDQEYLVIQYYVTPRYSVESMNNYLPNPDYLLIGVILVNSILFSFFVAGLFAKKLRNELVPIVQTTAKIKEKNLDFEINPSTIKEFNDVLDSLSEMKNELKKSLETQWRQEQRKNEQIAMLSHDIKTPLTIVKGNADLLREVKEEEKEEFLQYILEGAEEIENYVQMVLYMTKTENEIDVHFKKINTACFINDVLKKLKALANQKGIAVEYKQEKLLETFHGDSTLLQRALLNVFANAVDYSEANGKITFIVSRYENHIRFTVIDSGKGFSEVDLTDATSKFYMNDKSRTKKGHYGMGLYITNNIVNLHFGKLTLENCKRTKGAKVTIEIPI